MSKKISESTVRRLSLYLRSLREAVEGSAETISSEELADRGGTTAAQVRKDLSMFGSFGKRGMGYPTAELTRAIEEILGLHRRWRVAVIGAGKIGSALVAYRNFHSRGFEIVAVFDTDPAKVGAVWGGQRIQPDEALERVVSEREIDIAIIAVPGTAAQSVADRVVASGVRALLNFAPVRLRVPEDVALRNVDMVLELEQLTYALNSAEF